MQKTLFTLFLAILVPNAAMAYDLNGSMSREGDGSYSVALENNYGHEYNGEATDSGNGALDVTVEDNNGQSYSGTATPDGNGDYELDLQNDSSGGVASGIATIDN